MSDIHRPFWISISVRTRLALLLVLIIMVAAVVGLVDRTGRSSGTRAAAPRPGAAVPVDDRTGAASTAPTHPAAPTASPATTVSPATTAAPTHPAAPTQYQVPSQNQVPSATPTAASPASLTYVVKRGDNLTVIAAWFHLHGYGALYERNKAVIGSDPNLILPGQRITLSATGVSMSMSSSR